MPVYILWGIMLATVLFSKRIRINYIGIWLLFIIATLFSVNKGITTEWIKDISVLLSYLLICMSLPHGSIDAKKMLRIIYKIGFVVAIFVLLDTFTGLFKTVLIGIYSQTAREHKLFNNSSGGIFSNVSMAGCFIVAGAMSFITQMRMKKKKISPFDISVIAVFLISFILLKKRAFLLALVLSIACIWLIKLVINRKRSSSISPSRIIRTIIALLFLVLCGLFLYQKVTFLQDAVNNYIARFITSDTTLSGRTLLYDLAFRLYHENPVFGVGWARYREYTYGVFGKAYTATYDVHNVFLQLLCETGIVGLLFFILAVVLTILKSVRSYKAIINSPNSEDLPLFEFGLFSQLFFICYCMSGNPLYDYQHLSYYFFGIIICDIIMAKCKNEVYV